MSPVASKEKPHAVFVPFPAQGHINPMLQLAKLLNYKGFHITFVNTEFNHKRMLESQGSHALDGLPSFQFKTIPDGLPPADADARRNLPLVCDSTSKTCLAPFEALLTKLNSSPDSPPVTCIVADGVSSFTLDAAEHFGIPEVLFWTTSACGLMGYVQYYRLIEKGLTPFKDAKDFANGYLDTEIDWIPGMKDIRLKDMPSFIRTTDPNDIMLHYMVSETERSKKASAIILNTFDALEQEVVDALSTLLPPIYSIGPLQLPYSEIPSEYNDLKAIGSNLWAENTECLNWLDTKEPNSVVYVNFGSTTVMTNEQLVEFSWGLANSKKPFLWIIRPGLVAGETAVVPPEFLEETKDRGMLASWCPQEQVLLHSAIGWFLTHSGWNSTLEALCGGVPLICWPFFAEQQTNVRYSCTQWGIGIEIDGEVKRDYIDGLVRTLMDGEEGKKMRKKALEWKKLAEEDPGLLDGNWVLLYTASSELLPLLAAGSTPLLKVSKIGQSIDTSSLTIVNSTTLSGPFATFSFSASASFEVRSPSRIQVEFKEGSVLPPKIKSSVDLPQEVDIFGQKINLSPVQRTLNPLQEAVASISRAISGQPPFKVSIPGERTKSWLLITYLDEDLRISRGDGGLFVLAREGSPLIVQ